MFDLEVAIAGWKQELVERRTFSQEDLQELEAHLWAAIDEQTARGRDQEEAFAWACYSVGTADRLAAEYGKVSQAPIWRERVLWILYGYLGGRVMGSSIGAIGTLSVAALAPLGWSGTVLGYVAISVEVACWASLVLALWRLSRSQVAPSGRMATGLLPWVLLIIAIIGSVLEFTGRAFFAWTAQRQISGEFFYSLAWGNAIISMMVFAVALVLLWLLKKTGESSPNEPSAG